MSSIDDHGAIQGRLGAGQHVWSTWSLSRQFLTCASFVLMPAMWIMGLWVSSHIQKSATHRAGISAALYMENFLEPLVQDLGSQERLSTARSALIARLLTDTSLGQRVYSFKVWGRGSVVVASSRPEIVGQSFPASAGLQAAWNGVPRAEFDHLREVENQPERASGIPLLEVYIPLRERGTDRIVAVGEFYEHATDLGVELRRARVMSWLVVSGVALSMLSALYWIVQQGSRTIARQQGALHKQVAELTGLLGENRKLRAQAQVASARASEANEAYLHRLGADLHDGPAQLISLALMHLDDARAPQSRPSITPSGPPGATSALLTDALKDIRNIAEGLAIPGIDQLALGEAVAAAVERHEALTGTPVALAMNDMPNAATQALKLCCYRFVQEGLSNAFRHACGSGQRVTCTCGNRTIRLVVEDSGAGMNAIAAQSHAGLGLQGLKHRIESLGGALHVESSPGEGTRLTAELPLDEGNPADV